MLTRNDFSRSVTLAILLGALAGGCDVADAPADVPVAAWKDMNGNQRVAYMTSVVVPRMKEIYQRFDPVKFERFDCTTCHGNQAAAAGTFKMPAAEVQPLPATPEAFEAKLAAEPTWPRWTQFMVEEVEPPMAEMLGQPLWDPTKPEAPGFSCQACHGLEK